MSAHGQSARTWRTSVWGLLATVVLSHLLAVWAAPHLIMQVLMNGPTARSMNIHNQAAFAARVTAASRDVVMPSPDLLYSVCAYDLSQGPVHISANPDLPTYWSIALYAANSDNFFVINDRQANGQPVDLWLVAPGTSPPASASAAPSRMLVAPSKTGFLLMRLLTSNYAAEKDTLEPARRTLRCTPG